MRFSFQGKNVVMTPSGEPTISIMLSSIAGYVRSMFEQKQLKELAGLALKKLETVIEPLHYGKFID